MPMVKALLLLASMAVSLSHDVAPSSVDVQRLVSEAAERHGIPVWLGLRVAQIESHLNCFALGSAGELGPLQIKPSTARFLGFNGDDRELRSCGAGLEWGMKHLELALQRGGVWKHQQGLFAKRKSPAALAYEEAIFGIPPEDPRSRLRVSSTLLAAD